MIKLLYKKERNMSWIPAFVFVQTKDFVKFQNHQEVP
jgi:hypothetical protein